MSDVYVSFLTEIHGSSGSYSLVDYTLLNYFTAGLQGLALGR